MLGKNNDWKRMNKGGEMHILPQLVKSMYFFLSQIDLKFTKLQKKA